MKRSICALFALLVLLAALPAAYAADGGSYLFDLSCDGSHTRQAVTDDIITLTLTLRRTDSQDSAPMYAMQDELCYDPAFFQLVEGSAITAASIQTAELSLRDGWRSFYMNFVSLDGDGAVWPAELPVGTVQLRVIGQSGASTVTQRSYLVSDSGGGALPVSAQDLTVVVSDSCTVRFDSCGGSPVAPCRVARGRPLPRPAVPVCPGHSFVGWYRDIDCTDPWDFELDAVERSMTLYARWR